MPYFSLTGGMCYNVLELHFFQIIQESNNIQVTCSSQGNIDAAVKKIETLIYECTPLILKEKALKDKVIDLFRSDNHLENICRRTRCKISLDPKVHLLDVSSILMYL